MKLTKHLGVFLVAGFMVAIGAAIFSAGVGAQEEGWQIVRADYGFRSQRSDVTDILKDLVGRGGVNGRVVVNNRTMGGDPAVGRDKSLRIFVRNRRNEEREFNFNEGAFVDVRMFDVRMMDSRHDDWDDRRPNHGDRDREDRNGLRIIRGYYGVQGRTVNVTELLRSRVRDGVLSIAVTNSALGGDPAIGADKTLIVVYQYQGNETAAATHEGYTLTIP
jgi:DnaJ-like protein C11, C-terminal